MAACRLPGWGPLLHTLVPRTRIGEDAKSADVPRSGQGSIDVVHPGHA